MKLIPYPAGKQFAFTFTDDTDFATPESVRTVYSFIEQNGFRATKTVWVFPAKRKSGNPEKTGQTIAGSTLQEQEYYMLVKQLQENGHEIALHMASSGNNTREETIAAYEMFYSLFGFYPKTNINHGRNCEGIYWNRDIYTGSLAMWLAWLYISDRSEGHVEESPYFWGDICKKHTRYIRGYKSCLLNTLGFNPSMPYFERKKPYVNRWFSSTDLAEPWLLRKIVTDKNLKQLIRNNGACIGYTYLHKFVNINGELAPDFIQAIEKINKYKSQGWFVTASELLDRLEAVRNIKITVNKKHFQLVNTSSEPVYDVWVTGKRGDVIENNNGEAVCIGEDGVARFSCVHGSSQKLNQPDTQLHAFEFYNMQIHQIYLLFLRHLHGRKFSRKGWIQ